MSKIKLALDVVKGLRSLADSMEIMLAAIAANEPQPAKPAPVKTELETKKADSKEPKKPTLEELRALMAAKNKEGHREEVKAILTKYEANKLTALDSKHYTKVLIEVEKIK